MGNTVEPIIWNGILFDSNEEKWFAQWLTDLTNVGLIENWVKSKTSISLTAGLKIPYQKITVLKTKTKIENKEYTLLRPSEYTPDFEIYWSLEGFDKCCSEIQKSFDKSKLFFTTYFNCSTIVEIKPVFDSQNMERLFVNNQKFIWDKHNLFINLIEPLELFKKTFVPSAAMPDFIYKKAPTGKNKGKKTKGDFKYDFEPKLITQFLKL